MVINIWDAGKPELQEKYLLLNSMVWQLMEK